MRKLVLAILTGGASLLLSAAAGPAQADTPTLHFGCEAERLAQIGSHPAGEGAEGLTLLTSLERP